MEETLASPEAEVRFDMFSSTRWCCDGITRPFIIVECCGGFVVKLKDRSRDRERKEAFPVKADLSMHDCNIINRVGEGIQSLEKAH